MRLLLRSASVLAFSAVAFAASAQVAYRFSGTFTDVHGTVSDAFTFVSPTFITGINPPGTLTNTSSSLFTIASVAFLPGTPSVPTSLDGFAVSHTIPPLYDGGTGITGYSFAHGAFGAFGTYTAVQGGNGITTTGTLTVSPVPEPSVVAALGLGAVAVLRRRKRA